MKKEYFYKVMELYSRQSWIIDREDRLLELQELCETPADFYFIIDLLRDFHFLDDNVFSSYLNQIAQYIINDSSFHENKTQIASITYDDGADSSQKILDHIKIFLFKAGWSKVQTVNRYGSIPKNFRAGLRQIIFVDEFVGSGSTVVGRIKQLKNDIKDDFELKCCFVAGMEFGIRNIEQTGIEVFCPLRLPRGISDRFKPPELEAAVGRMKTLESKLCKQVNDFKLSTYSFGYKEAEALYSLEGLLGNTPNSVFPVFWWPRDSDGSERKTLLTRYERGLK